MPPGYLFRMLNQILFGVVIGPKASIGPGLIIVHSNGVVINRQAQIGHHLIVQHQVTIGQSNLGIPTIGNYVYCGCGAKILGKLTVGDNVKIGANAVVVKDVPPMCTVAGIPAKIIRQHSMNQRKQSSNRRGRNDNLYPLSDRWRHTMRTVITNLLFVILMTR